VLGDFVLEHLQLLFGGERVVIRPDFYTAMSTPIPPRWSSEISVTRDVTPRDTVVVTVPLPDTKTNPFLFWCYVHSSSTRMGTVINVLTRCASNIHLSRHVRPVRLVRINPGRLDDIPVCVDFQVPVLHVSLGIGLSPSDGVDFDEPLMAVNVVNHLQNLAV
jgi:hypothetical protein